jgi:hypothetical protein
MNARSPLLLFYCFFFFFISISACHFGYVVFLSARSLFRHFFVKGEVRFLLIKGLIYIYRYYLRFYIIFYLCHGKINHNFLYKLKLLFFYLFNILRQKFIQLTHLLLNHLFFFEHYLF